MPYIFLALTLLVTGPALAAPEGPEPTILAQEKAPPPPPRRDCEKKSDEVS